MKTLKSKNAVSATMWRNLAVCTAIGLTGLFVGCSDDDIKPGNEEELNREAGKITLQIIPGSAQTGRVKNVVKTRATQRKRDRLTHVATVMPVGDKEKYHWSATAIAFDGTGTQAYVTWHSDYQATTVATCFCRCQAVFK